MASIGALINVLPQLRQTSLAKHHSTSDAELLERFVSQRDEVAFEVILRRHGPMVFNVCLRVLRHAHDAEDAFQATFLVLAHKTTAIPPRSNLAGWLHGVAHKTALKARYKSNLRVRVEMRVPSRSPDEMHPDTNCNEAETVLDQEIATLPDRYRLPIILCDLESRLQVDVAGILGCTVGTLSSRLTRGRRLLAVRLKHRGFGLSVTAIAAVLAKRSSALAESLILATVPAVLSSLATPAWVGSAVSQCVAQLATGVMKDMFIKKLQMAALAAFLTFAVAAFALTCVPAFKTQAATLPRTTQAPALDKKARGDTLNYIGKVTDRDTGKPILGVAVTVRRFLDRDTEGGSDLILGESKHMTDAEGKYSFTIPPEQSSQPSLMIWLELEHPDYAPKKGLGSFGDALSIIRKNEKLGERPFFESVEMRPAKPAMGVVKLPDGKPATGVKILAYSVTNKRLNKFEYGSFAETCTDAEGKFRIPLTTPGLAVVWVLPQEYVPSTHILNEKRGDLGIFTLESGPRLKGKVLDSKGKPLAGVFVNAELRDQNDKIPPSLEFAGNNIKRSALTNERGEFEMKPLPQGNYLVKPGQHQDDNILDLTERRKQAEVPGVFIGTKVTLNGRTASELIEVRAIPHVTIEAQHFDSKGKPIRGFNPNIFGRIDGIGWLEYAKTDASGKVVALVPHGLEDATLILDGPGVVRWRKGKDSPLNNHDRVMLGTMNDDMKDIEIIHYNAPILLVKITTKDGTLPDNTVVSAVYPRGRGPIAGPKSNGRFEKQTDGRFRSEQLYPDEDVDVMGHANGYADKSEKVNLAEGTTKEIEIVLEKVHSAKDSEKKDK
jgi:RNA polymerase sigma factor (sigma-70 family)